MYFNVYAIQGDKELFVSQIRSPEEGRRVKLALEGHSVFDAMRVKNPATGKVELELRLLETAQ